MKMDRRRERISVDVPVTVTTVLDSIDAVIANLTEDGALVIGASQAEGAQIMLDSEGHSVFGRVMWSEIDRMGVRFLLPLCDGPLHTALETARAMRDMPAPAMVRPAFGRRSIG